MEGSSSLTQNNQLLARLLSQNAEGKRQTHSTLSIIDKIPDEAGVTSTLSSVNTMATPQSSLPKDIAARLKDTPISAIDVPSGGNANASSILSSLFDNSRYHADALASQLNDFVSSSTNVAPPSTPVVKEESSSILTRRSSNSVSSSTPATASQSNDAVIQQLLNMSVEVPQNNNKSNSAQQNPQVRFVGGNTSMCLNATQTNYIVM